MDNSRRRYRRVCAALASGMLSLSLVAAASASDTGSLLSGLDPAAATPAPSAVAQALAAPLADGALGGAVVGEVLDARTGAVLWSRSPQAAVMPASTTKLLTAAAALTVLGPADRPVTGLLSTGTVTAGRLQGDLVLHGGGDVLLAAAATGAWPARADVDQLAAGLRAAGVTEVTGHLVADGSLFTGPKTATGWNGSYVRDGSVAPVTALGVDEGGPATAHGNRSADPRLAAADALRAALSRQGITVRGRTVIGSAPARARTLTEVSGPTVLTSVEEMLQNSDNDAAEALGRRVAIRKGLPATFEGAARAVTDAVQALKVPLPGLHLDDASGLSRADRIAPATLVTLLRLAASASATGNVLRPLLTGLGIGGFDGTVASRYRTGPAAVGGGLVHAKTGALEGVTSLAGTVVDSHGRQLIFAWITDAVTSRPQAEAAVDRAAAALAAL